VAAISFAGLLIFGFSGQNILDLLVGYGNVSSDNLRKLWWIMLCLGGMFAGGAMGQISSSSFYALGDTKTPTRIGVYSYTVYIPAKIALFYYFGVLGLALVTSMFLIVNLYLQHWQIQKKFIYFQRRMETN
jgi:peptidoglycan biosynthesis protein MviN/MurJ (putative lipid II flippase)